MKCKEITDILRRERRAFRISQDAIAFAINKRQTEIARYETGRNIPVIDTLDEWASQLGYELVLKKKQP